MSKDLHLYGQHAQHEECAIVGTRDALETLRDRLSMILKNLGAAPENDTYFAGDGEGFELLIIAVPEGELKDWALPYTDKDVYVQRKDAKSPFWPGDHVPDQGVMDLLGMDEVT